MSEPPELSCGDRHCVPDRPGTIDRQLKETTHLKAVAETRSPEDRVAESPSPMNSTMLNQLNSGPQQTRIARIHNSIEEQAARKEKAVGHDAQSIILHGSGAY